MSFGRRLTSKIAIKAVQSDTGEPAPKFSATVKTIIKQIGIDVPAMFQVVISLENGPVAHAVSAAMYLQLRNTTQMASTIDSCSVEAKSDRGNWETMRI